MAEMTSLQMPVWDACVESPHITTRAARESLVASPPLSRREAAILTMERFYIFYTNYLVRR